MLKYYKVLDLPMSAPLPEVKRQYRKMAKKYHPDVNPTLIAKNKFIEITEAYEIITGQRSLPKSFIQNDVESHEKTKEERIKEARVRYKKQKIKEQLENELYFQSLLKSKLWKVIKFNAVLGVVLSIFLLADLFLPVSYKPTTVTHYNIAAFMQSGERVGEIYTTEGDYYVKNLDYLVYTPNSDVYISQSYIYHNPTGLTAKNGEDLKNYDLVYTVYVNTFLLIVLFTLPILTIKYKRKTITFTVLYFFSGYVVSAVTILFLLSNSRIIHLLTLGVY